MDDVAIFQALEKGVKLLSEICGTPPTCSAAPGWKTTDSVLRQKERFGFRYNSDCRGESVFLPTLGNETLTQPQVPVTLPTYDELIGRNGITNENYNDHLLSLIQPGRLNVLTIHAEVEGIVCRDLFADFLQKAAKRKIEIVPLGSLLENSPPAGRIVPQELPGREGWIAFQA